MTDWSGVADVLDTPEAAQRGTISKCDLIFLCSIAMQILRVYQ